MADSRNLETKRDQVWIRESNVPPEYRGMRMLSTNYQNASKRKSGQNLYAVNVPI
jgi:hypothetical protein